MKRSIFLRLAAHPALLLIVIILPLVLLSALLRRVRDHDDEADYYEGYELIHPVRAKP